MSNVDMHDALVALITEINRLRPDWRDAQEFYSLRSEITGRLRSLAASPLAVKTLIRPIKIEVPAAPVPTPDGLPVTLNTDEMSILFYREYTRSGGFQDRFRKWQQRIDRKTGLLLLSTNDVAWVWRTGSRPWKGSIQRRTRKIFWRALSELFASLGLTPDLTPITPTSRGHAHRGGPGRTVLPPRQLTDNPKEDKP